MISAKIKTNIFGRNFLGKGELYPSNILKGELHPSNIYKGEVHPSYIILDPSKILLHHSLKGELHPSNIVKGELQ